MVTAIAFAIRTSEPWRTKLLSLPSSHQAWHDLGVCGGVSVGVGELSTSPQIAPSWAPYPMGSWVLERNWRILTAQSVKRVGGLLLSVLVFFLGYCGIKYNILPPHTHFPSFIVLLLIYNLYKFKVYNVMIWNVKILENDFHNEKWKC